MSLGEFDIIGRYFAKHDLRRDVLLGVGDDAAVMDVPQGRKLVVAMDTVVEGVHFPVTTAARIRVFRIASRCVGLLTSCVQPDTPSPRKLAVSRLSSG